jgi:hypothetical protein
VEIRRGAIEEFANRGEWLDAQSCCSQESAERVEYIRIVVDKDNNRLSLFVGRNHSGSGRPLPAR